MFYRLLNAELCLSDAMFLLNYREGTHTFDKIPSNELFR